MSKVINKDTRTTKDSEFCGQLCRSVLQIIFSNNIRKNPTKTLVAFFQSSHELISLFAYITNGVIVLSVSY